MLKTLAAKHRSTVTKMARKYKATIDTPHGPRTLLRGQRRTRPAGNHWSPRFGGIPLQTAEERGPRPTASQPRPPPAARS